MARGTLRVRIVGDARDLQRTLGNATGQIGRFARRGMLALGAAAVAGTAASVRAFANFDQAMTNSLAIMGDVSDTMRREMSDAAREVGRTTQFSATEAAESFYFLASAGLEASQQIEAMPKVAEFAQAGQFDLARATDLLTDAQSALGLAASDAQENLSNLTRVSDVLVGANTLANASVEEFSEALTNKAGAAMRDLNMDIEEGVAVLAVYADQGSKGSEAGTRLNATLEGLTRTARTNKDAYERLGVAVFDTDGEMRNMADIVGDLEGSLEGMSTEQRNAELASLGLTRQARDGVIALLENSDAIRDYEGALRDAGGTTGEVADNQMQTFWAQLGLVKDNVVDIGLSIGEALMPALMSFVEWVQERLPDITSGFQDMAERFVSFFTGDTEAAVDESKGHLDGWAIQAIAERDKVLESYAQMPPELRAVLPKPDDFDEFVQTSSQAGEDAGDGFMDRLREAIAEVWEQDIKPWIDDTLVPWFTDDFGPRFADAAYEVGKVAGWELLKGLSRGVWYIVHDLPYEMGKGWGENARESFERENVDTSRMFSNGMMDLAGNGIGGFRQAWDDDKDQVVEAPATTLLDTLQRAQEEVGRDGANWNPLGTSMLTGIRTGLMNSGALSSLRSAASSAVTSALTAARSAMGISSPSKVMAEQVGVPMAEGLIQGLTSQADAISRAQLSVLGGSIPSMPSSARMQAAGGRGTPVVIPVMIDVDGVAREVGRSQAFIDSHGRTTAKRSRLTADV